VPISKVDGDRSAAWLRYASGLDGYPPLLEPLPSLTHEGPWCPGCSVATGYKMEQRSCRCRCNGLQLWTINMQHHPKNERNPCRRQRSYHGFKDGAAVVVMPPDAYDKKTLLNDHRLTRLIQAADLLQRASRQPRAKTDHSLCVHPAMPVRQRRTGLRIC
jgi:hypothetical protein